MPIFEYICRECQHRFEAIVLGAKPPRCPKCESKKLEQQVGRFARGRKEKAASEAYTMRSLVAGAAFVMI
jgi:putative FmdB family regulatory protein